MTDTISVLDAAAFAVGALAIALAMPGLNTVRIAIRDRMRVKRRVSQVIAMIPFDS